MHSLLASRPLVSSWKPRIKFVLLACNITAPAPSPNKIHVFLSDQSTHWDKTSAPTIRIFLYEPVCINWFAVIKPIIKPEQAAVISKATAFVAPILACNWLALPNKSFWLDVARTIKSKVCGFIFALSIAFCHPC